MSQETIILAANAQRTERIGGRFFTVLSATAKFDVELEGRKRRTVRIGSKISGDVFKRISFFETEGVENTVLFDAGDEQFQGEVQVSGISNDTFVYAPAFMNVSGITLTLTTTSQRSIPLMVPISGVNYTRKSFHIVNRTGGNDVGVYATSGRLLDICIGNTERTFSFNQDVVINSIGGDSLIAVYFTLYTTTPES